MDAIRNIPELIVEFITRRDYIAFYLGFVGFWCLWLSYRGLQFGSTQGFGWRPPDAAAEAAVAAGRSWLAIGVALLVSGAALWFTS